MNRGNYGVLQRYAVLQRAVQHADVVIGSAGAHDGGDEHPDPNYPGLEYLQGLVNAESAKRPRAGHQPSCFL